MQPSGRSTTPIASALYPHARRFLSGSRRGAPRRGGGCRGQDVDLDEASANNNDASRVGGAAVAIVPAMIEATGGAVSRACCGVLPRRDARFGRCVGRRGSQRRLRGRPTRGPARRRPDDRVRPRRPHDPMEHRLRHPARTRRVLRRTVRRSCRTGVCHTCETTLVAGDVHYSPDPVERPTGGSVFICCSQPRDDIVLDL